MWGGEEGVGVWCRGRGAMLVSSVRGRWVHETGEREGGGGCSSAIGPSVEADVGPLSQISARSALAGVL